MSYIDASTARASPLLSALKPGMGSEDDEPEAGETPEQEAAEPQPDDDEDQAPPDGSPAERLLSQIDDVNLARGLERETLDRIAACVVREYEIDERSRSDWADTTQKALDFTLQKTQPKTFPWAGASNVIFPLITQSALEFGARTYPAVIQGRNVVKGVVWGEDKGTPVKGPDGKPRMAPAEGGQPGPDGQPQMQPVWLIAPGEKRLRADRIAEHMSYQLLCKMPEWEPQTDQMMHQIPITGGAARKTYRDPVQGRNFSVLVSLMNLVWDYHAASFEAAPRHTEKLNLYPHEITELERAGREAGEDDGCFLHLDYGPAGGGDVAEQAEFDNEAEAVHEDDPDAPHFFIEQHRRWDLDEDGYAEPYIVTVHHRSARVVRIVARYDREGVHADEEGDILRVDPLDCYTLYPFLPNVEGGSYPYGFGHLLKGLNASINTALNQMFDAGTLQNAGGGFIGDGVGGASGPLTFSVGRWHRLQTKGMSLRDAILPLAAQGPSPVLFQLLGTLLTAGKQVAGVQDILTGDSGIANAPPTTVLALIEQGIKVYTAIIKRLYRAMKAEFDKLYRLNRLYLDGPETYRVGDEDREVTPDDYRMAGGVEPVADPTQVTDMQRLVRSQIVAGFIGTGRVNDQEAVRRVLDAAGVERIDDLMPQPNPMAAQLAQLEMDSRQADLGRTRAAELKDSTQAFLNMALARAKASQPEMDFIDQQMQFLRYQIEALNTQVKAAAVDHKFHDTNMRSTLEHARLAAGQAAAGPQPGDGAPGPAAGPVQIGPAPGPVGPFPSGPGPGPGAGPGGLQPVAPSPGDAGGAALPGGPG